MSPGTVIAPSDGAGGSNGHRRHPRGLVELDLPRGFVYLPF